MTRVLAMGLLPDFGGTVRVSQIETLYGSGSMPREMKTMERVSPLL
jgi:hypothetical protein